MRRGLLLLAGPIVVAALAIAGVGTARAQLGENLQPGRVALCGNEGLCPALEAAPHVGIRLHLLGKTERTVTVGGIEKWAELPLTPSFIENTYWAGWGTGNPLKGTYREVFREGLVVAGGWTAGVGMGGPIPAGTEVTVWMFPVVEEVRWTWGEPCQHPYGWSGACGHYIAVSDPEGGSVTTSTLSAPLVRHAARVKR